MSGPRNPGRLSGDSPNWPTSWDARMEAVLATLVYMLSGTILLMLLGALVVFVWRTGWPAVVGLGVLSVAFCATYRFVVRRNA